MIFGELFVIVEGVWMVVMIIMDMVTYAIKVQAVYPKVMVGSRSR